MKLSTKIIPKKNDEGLFQKKKCLPVIILEASLIRLSAMWTIRRHFVIVSIIIILVVKIELVLMNELLMVVDTLMGFLPILTLYGGEEVHTTLAILHYLAKETGTPFSTLRI